MALFLGLPRWAGTRKVNPIWILLKQQTVSGSGSGISWAICKSAPCYREITTPASHHFYRSDALPAAQPTASRHSNSGLNQFAQEWSHVDNQDALWFLPTRRTYHYTTNHVVISAMQSNQWTISWYTNWHKRGTADAYFWVLTHASSLDVGNLTQLLQPLYNNNNNNNNHLTAVCPGQPG